MGSTTDFLEWAKKNHPKAYEDFLDRKTKYGRGKDGKIIEIENPDFIGSKKAKGGMINKYAKGGSVKKKNKMATTKGWGASRKT